MKVNELYSSNLDFTQNKPSKSDYKIEITQLIKILSDRQAQFEKMLQKLTNHMNSKNFQKKIVLWKNEKAILYNISNIVSISINSGKTIISTESMEDYETKYSLIFWEQKLKQNLFLRCHRNYIVNINKINEIIPWFNNTYLLKLSNNTEAHVSRKYTKEFKKIIARL